MAEKDLLEFAHGLVEKEYKMEQKLGELLNSKDQYDLLVSEIQNLIFAQQIVSYESVLSSARRDKSQIKVELVNVEDPLFSVRLHLNGFHDGWYKKQLDLTEETPAYFDRNNPYIKKDFATMTRFAQWLEEKFDPRLLEETTVAKKIVEMAAECHPAKTLGRS